MARRQEELLVWMRPALHSSRPPALIGQTIKLKEPVEEEVDEEEPDPLVSENLCLHHEFEEAWRTAGNWQLDVVPEVGGSVLVPEQVFLSFAFDV
ncbi:hypothetical protein JCM3774_000583 [Rhodotorula dairenensis]